MGKSALEIPREAQSAGVPEKNLPLEFKKCTYLKVPQKQTANISYSSDDLISFSKIKDWNILSAILKSTKINERTKKKTIENYLNTEKV